MECTKYINLPLEKKGVTLSIKLAFQYRPRREYGMTRPRKRWKKEEEHVEFLKNRS
jgi:hypothetical protein